MDLDGYIKDINGNPCGSSSNPLVITFSTTNPQTFIPPIERIIYKTEYVEIPVIKEVIKEVEKVVEVEKILEVPVEVKVEVEKLVYKTEYIDKPVEIEITKYVEVPVEKEVIKEVERIVYQKENVYLTKPEPKSIFGKFWKRIGSYFGWI